MSRLQNLRVLVTTESFGQLNGVSRATLAFCSYLKRKGTNYQVLAPEGRNLLAQDRSYPVRRLRGIPLPMSPDLRVVSPFILTRQFLRPHWRPSVVYLASPASLGLLVWLQARGLHTPMVVNYQTELSEFAQAVLPRPLRRLAAALIDRVTATIFNDRMVRAVLATKASFAYLKRIGVDERKLRGIQRGVDTVQFSPANRSLALRQQLAPDGERLLLYVGRLAFEKNLPLLAEVNSRLLASAEEEGLPPFRFLIVGGNENRATEQTIKRSFAGQPNVTFTGPLVGDELAAHYASADLFTFPALHETFGQVVQEAMASGLPVVAMASGGPANIVRHAETGLLCPTDDPATNMTASISRLLRAEPERARMAVAARDFAEQRSWDDVNQQILDVLVASAEQ